MSFKEIIYIFIENLKLRTKLVSLFTILVGSIALFIYLYFPNQLEQSEIAAVAAKGESIAEMTAFSISPALFFEDVENIEEALNGAKQNPDLKYLIVTDVLDTVVCAYNRTSAKKAGYKNITNGKYIAPDELFYRTMKPIYFKELEIGKLYLGLSLSELKLKVLRSKNSITFLSLIIFIIGLIAIVWISTITTRPLRYIVQTAEKISAGDFTKRVNILSKDEIGQLAKAFDRMVDKLGYAYEELELLNKNLEKRVEQRTQELQNEINERKQAEEALIASEDLNRGIITNSPVGILYLDAEGRIIFENPAMEKLIGIPDGKLSQDIGKRIADVPNFRNSEIYGIFQKVLNGSKVKGVQIEYKSLKGAKKHLDIYAAPRHDSNVKIVGAVLMCVDITDYKDLEDQLRQAQKMEAVGTLAGGIAHDFNNILTGVLGNLEFVLMKKNSDFDIIPLIEQAKQSAERAAELTAQMLAFGRRKMEMPKPTNLNKCIEESVHFLRRTLNPLIEIKIEKDPGLKTVQADSGQIQQVLVNLMINAGDAMKDGGILKIKSENYFVDEKYCLTNSEAFPGEYAVLTVSDTGVGIDSETIIRIFEPFFTTKEVGKGTGLGLAMVYGIVKGHKGWIEVKSEAGKGATFKIFLPISEDVEKARQDKPDKKALIGGDETILLVDDEEMVRSLGNRILHSVGYKTLLANDGVEAIEIYQQKISEIDLVILDLSMPRKSGKETMTELKKMNSQVKIIISSGFDRSGDVQKLLEAGAYEFIQKPFQLQNLLKIIRKVLDSN